ncbi:MAG: PorV/PorQ family protein [Endomicrobiales bacterium]|jgi:tetratricopeptide (TPR) repeat protein
MRSKNIVCCAIALITAGASLSRAGTGTSAADFIQIVADPQSAAMADSIVYAPPSAAVMLSNPAAMTSVYQAKLSLTNMTLGEDVNYRFAGVVIPSRSASLGMAVSYLTYGNIQSYDNTGASLGTIAPQSLMAVLSGAIPFRREYPSTDDYGSIGASVKMVQSNLAGYTAQSLAADVGALFHPLSDVPLTGGIALKNIGGSLSYIDQSDPFPLTADLGVKYEKLAWSDLIVTADASYVFSEEVTGVGAGISICPVYPVTLRVGYKQIADNIFSGFRMGVGLDFNDFSLNYAVLPTTEFSVVQQLGLEIAFGKIVRPDIAYNYYLTYHFEIAKEKFKRKDYLAARQELEEILSLYPDHQESKEYLVRIGQALDELEKQRMVGITRWLNRARVAFARNNLLQARRYYNYVLGVDPDNAEANEAITRIDDTARKLRMKEGLSENKSELVKLWDESLAYYHNGSYFEAKEGFKKYLTLNPSSVDAEHYINEIDAQLQKITIMQTNDLFVKGMELYEQGKYRDAMKYFNAVQMAMPSRTDAQQYADRCQAFLNAEEEKTSIEQQEQSKEKVKEKIKEQIDLSYTQSVSLYHNGEYDEALQSFAATRDLAVKYPGFERTALSARNYINIIKSQFAEKQFKSGFALAQDGKLESAAAAYRKALEFNPDHVSAKEELARISEILAQRFYEQGMNAYTAGDIENATACFKKALFYKPDKSEALRALERIK